MHATRSAKRHAVAPLLISLLLALSACGGGGGGDAGAGSGGPTLASTSGSGTGSGTGTGTSAGGGGTGAAAGGGTGVAAGGGASPSTGGNTNPPAGGGTTAPPAGSPGDDTYAVNDSNAVIVELPGGGTDTVVTSVNFTLPANVENLQGSATGLALVLVGNELDNVIVGSPFTYERIYGGDGNDTLDGGGREGAYIEGGNGDDRLIVSVGTLVGGPGADTFVAAGRGAHTTPEAPITIRDFNAAEGDRIEIYSSQAWSSADLWARGILRFDVATSTLILDVDPATTAPTSVDQVIVLEGVTAFDPAWVTFTVR